MPNLKAVRTDITTLRVDAIVNAANESLLGGGGVDGAIHLAAGPALLAACRSLPEVRPGVRCPTGQARSTPGFELHARHVIHTAGPVWQGGNSHEPTLLKSCYRTCLIEAANLGVRTIAFPAISTGVYHFPKDLAAKIAVDECMNATSLDDITFALFDAQTLAVYEAELGKRFPKFL
ncbi:MAG: O-acetyl-ADP-ribose deacetylase [Phycisphaerae bacterium]